MLGPERCGRCEVIDDNNEFKSKIRCELNRCVLCAKELVSGDALSYDWEIHSGVLQSMLELQKSFHHLVRYYRLM